MKMVAVALVLMGVVAGCTRHQSPTSTASSGPQAIEKGRNRAGYGLHLGLGGYVSDSGVWD